MNKTKAIKLYFDDKQWNRPNLPLTTIRTDLVDAATSLYKLLLTAPEHDPPLKWENGHLWIGLT